MGRYRLVPGTGRRRLPASPERITPSAAPSTERSALNTIRASLVEWKAKPLRRGSMMEDSHRTRGDEMYVTGAAAQSTGLEGGFAPRPPVSLPTVDLERTQYPQLKHLHLTIRAHHYLPIPHSYTKYYLDLMDEFDQALKDLYARPIAVTNRNEYLISVVLIPALIYLLLFLLFGRRLIHPEPFRDPIITPTWLRLLAFWVDAA